MKKLLTGIIAIAGFIFSAHAQETRKPMDKPHHHERGMMQDLNLTAAQKEQQKTQRLEIKKQLAALDKMENLSAQERKEKKKAILQTQKDQMNSILTEEQKSKMAKMRSDRKEGHENNHAAKWDKMKERLNLSDEQVSNLKTAQEAYHLQAKAIRENNQYTSTEKKEKLMKLQGEHKESFKKFLTPDQLTKMKEYQKEAHKNKKNKKEFKTEKNTK